MDAIITTEPVEIITTEKRPLDQAPAAVYLSSLGSGSRRTMKTSLDTIAGILTGNPDCFACDWSKLRFQHTAAIRSKLVETVSETGKPLAPAYVNKMLCALRGTLKAAWRLGQMSSEDYMRAVDIPSVIGSSLPAGRGLESGEISALMAVCENDPGPAGARDAAILAVLYSAGLRREELVNLDLGSYNRETGKLMVRGKRSKVRTAYLVNGASLAMSDWLKIRRNEPGPLFLPVNKGGTIGTSRLTCQAVYNLLQKRAGEAGCRSFSPHDLRRTFVSDLLDNGADIATVARMAGHASVGTTARYDRRSEQAKVKAAGLLHVPYHGRFGREA